MKNETLQVLVNGKPVKQYVHEGRIWIEAKKGAQYEIKVKNNNWRRALAIVSVDGLDVLTGKPATKDSSGYVVNGWNSATIRGFRTSKEEVNAFEFAGKGESYAVTSPTGEQSSQNCGVIAVRLYLEKEKPYKPVMRRNFAEPMFKMSDRSWTSKGLDTPTRGGQSRGIMPDLDECYDTLGGTSCSTVDSIQMRSLSAGPTFDMGTKFSEETKADRVDYVEFEQGPLAEQVEIFYASRKALLEMGVDLDVKPAIKVPQAFKDDGFCKPPKR